jgi:uncharacterized protein YndB with AHSA1/START domain
MEIEVLIAAPPERVWPICTDLTRWGEWSPENQGGEWLDGAVGPGLGVRFRGRQRHVAAGEWETTSVVVAWDPPKEFAWAVGDAELPAATWRFLLSLLPSGTSLRHHVHMGPGPSGTTRVIEQMPDKEERIIARRLEEYQAGMTAVLAGIKAAVEGATR